MLKVALLGLGTMGGGMAANWLAKGFPLAVWNRSPGKAEAFAARGARVAATPRDAAAGADLIVSMVADDAASRAVWLGEDGALAGASEGATAIEMSTLSPGWMAELGGIAAARGLAVLDAPVTGSKAAAAAGQLVLLVGGDAGVLARMRPALEAISKDIVHLGGPGRGTLWKLINNMMVAIQVAAAAEGVAVAEKAGIDRTLATALIGDSGLASPLVKMKLERMRILDFSAPDFLLRLMAKDLRYGRSMAEAAGLDPALAAAASRYYEAGEAAGHGEEDLAAVLAAIREG